jgi:superfamily II DNA/RNA helicase
MALLLARLRALGFFGSLAVDERFWEHMVVRALELMPEEAAKARRAGKAAESLGEAAGTKCIVFSNFIEAIDSLTNNLSEALLGEGIFMRFTQNMKGGIAERASALQAFRDDPKIRMLIISDIGAVGLDLSFVSHIFILDPIWDQGLEDQVISRAHRLGAKRAVTVEKFIAEGTVEQMMEALAAKQRASRPSTDSECTSGQGGLLERRKKADESKKAKDALKVNQILQRIDMLPEIAGEEEEMLDRVTSGGESEARCQATRHMPGGAAVNAIVEGLLDPNTRWEAGLRGVGDLNGEGTGHSGGGGDPGEEAPRKRVRFND